MKNAPALSYGLKVTDLAGNILYCNAGSLRKCLEIFGDACFSVACGIDSYHKIRRELLRADGAYYCAYPGYDGPVILSIIEDKLTAPQPEYSAPLPALVAKHQRKQDQYDLEQAAQLLAPTPLEVLISDVQAEKAASTYNSWVATPAKGKKWPAYCDAGMEPDAPHCEFCNVPRWKALDGWHSCNNSRCTSNLGQNWKMGGK